MAISHAAFWVGQPGLVWSNPEADDSVRIRAALLSPRFLQLLEIAHEFGVERIEREWSVLFREGTPEARRSERAVRRILGNLRRGMARASESH